MDAFDKDWPSFVQLGFRRLAGAGFLQSHTKVSPKTIWRALALRQENILSTLRKSSADNWPTLRFSQMKSYIARGNREKLKGVAHAKRGLFAAWINPVHHRHPH